MSASKSMTSDLMTGDKLTDKNYDLWRRKMELLLEVEDLWSTVTNPIAEPAKDADQTAYQAWKKKDKIARITLLSCMSSDIMLRFERYRTSKTLWDAVKLQYGSTSTTRLRQLNLKFDGYKKRAEHSMREHLITMENMITELKNAGQSLSDEQQVQAVIRLLPKSWEHLRLNLTHNDSITTFEQVAHHVELEKDRLNAEKGTEEVFVASSSAHKRTKRKKENSNDRSKTNDKSGRGNNKGKDKRKERKGDMSKVKCYTCGKMGHFARDCAQAKTQPQQTI